MATARLLDGGELALPGGSTPPAVSEEKKMNNEIGPGNGNAGSSTGMVVRQEFNGTETMAQVETAATAVAARARATIEARYVLALRRPRDWSAVRATLVADCDRADFAREAVYSKPVGGQRIEGLSIRFAEAAIRRMTNVGPETAVVFDDAQKRIVEVSLTDFEANVPYTTQITINKTVERLKVKEGQEVLAVRTNSVGRKTYLVAATDDDIANKEAALCSKARRNQALALLPPEIKTECFQRCIEAIKKGDAKDPDATRKALVDGFMRLGVKPEMLRDYLGHPIDQATPDELTDLRAIGIALRDGEAKWGDVMEERRANLEAERRDAQAQPATTGEQPATSAPAPGARGTASLKEKLPKPAAKVDPAASAPATGKQAELPTGERQPGEDG